MIQNKRILVTGACGTVGSEIIGILLSGKHGLPDELIGIDNNESELFFLANKYSQKKANFLLRDMRNYEGLEEICTDIDIVIHTAALKHVGICELSPSEAVNTNIVGLQNIIRAAMRSSVKQFIFTSSDKAVNPTNVMGTSKLMGERLVTAANGSRMNRGTVFSSTRFGNVLGSRGSVVPIFRDQISRNSDLTLTSKDMSRFIMTIGEAANLVIKSIDQAKGGEVFITKMPVVYISTLAEVMIDCLAENPENPPKIVEIGTKPGEKLYEELMSEEETSHAVETRDYFIVLPAFRDLYPIDYWYNDALSNRTIKAYKSSDESPLDFAALKNYLLTHKVI